MKTLKSIALFALTILLFSSCGSSKSLQNSLQYLHFDLDYELTTDPYPGPVNQTVYLNSIDNSNMEYYTIVKKTSNLVLPFIFFNYWHTKYPIVLGENSLTQPYREFLTDALLAECNRSACFNLESSDETLNSDSNFILEVKILHNHTQSGIQNSNTVFVIPSYSASVSFSTFISDVLPVLSDLEIAVYLKKGTHRLFEKTYTVHEDLNYNHTSSDTKEECLLQMTECLSLATKKIVEEISNDLNIILLAQ
ncbi:hypothetical protein FACS189474_4900 [Bacteroidia bacterium]|nr:hypothetical protein FACS189474_4900 [Bacteroidia bacterium]